MEVSTKLCGVELCLVSSKQFISITQVHRRYKLRPKLDLEFLCHVIRIRDNKEQLLELIIKFRICLRRTLKQKQPFFQNPQYHRVLLKPQKLFTVNTNSVLL